MSRQIFSSIFGTVDGSSVVVGFIVWCQIDGSGGINGLELALLLGDFLVSCYTVDMHHVGGRRVCLWRGLLEETIVPAFYDRGAGARKDGGRREAGSHVKEVNKAA